MKKLLLLLVFVVSIFGQGITAKSNAGDIFYQNHSVITEYKVQANESVVYITKTGSKYHTADCRYLKKSKIKITKADAIEQGYTACKVCKP